MQQPHRVVRIVPGAFQFLLAAAAVCAALWTAQEVTHFLVLSSSPDQLSAHSWLAPLQAIVLLFSL